MFCLRIFCRREDVCFENGLTCHQFAFQEVEIECGKVPIKYFEIKAILTVRAVDFSLIFERFS